METLLTKNSKLGKDIRGVSMPRQSTCPGRSSVCSRLCYVSNFVRRFKYLNARYECNRKLALKPAVFYNALLNEIEEVKEKVIRFNISGDLFSVPYIKVWQWLARRLPGRVFYGYTRSWRVPKLLPHIQDLAAIPNVRLWLSTDKETGVPDLGIRTAYLMTDDSDIPPDKTDLVFRVKRKMLMSKINNAVVCPHEDGTNSGITCSQCGICWK